MDFYIKGIADNQYYENALQIQDPISKVLQRLEMVLFSNKGEVLGEQNLGLSLEEILFNLGYSVGDVEKELNEQINLYVDPTNRYQIETELFVKDDPLHNASILYIKILVNRKYVIKIRV